MKTYTVWINFVGTARYEIEADSAEEACDIAVCNADATDCYYFDSELSDWECECDEDEEKEEP